MPAGRPTDYREEMCEHGYKLALLGLTDAEMAAFFEVCTATFNTWKEVHPEFLESINRGKAPADGNVAEKMYRRAMGYSHEAVKIFMPANASEPVYAPYIEHYPPDTQAASLWLRNRQPGKWRDKQEHELTGKDRGPIELAVLTPEERRAKAVAAIDAAFAPLALPAPKDGPADGLAPVEDDKG